MATTTLDARLELALADLRAQKKPNIMGTAKRYELAESTLRRRFSGEHISRRAAAGEYLQNLTFAQEEALISQINRMSERGMPPTSAIVRNLAEGIIQRPVGKNWTGQFVKRYQNRLYSVYLRPIDKDRINAEYAPSFRHFYDLVIHAYERYNVTADNIYNWDEKGFLIGQASRTQRIMNKEAYDSGRIKYASQDGSREFISLLACISAIGTAIPPLLIYKGDSAILQDTWLNDYDTTDSAHFATSQNGWSCDAIGRKWLTEVFDRYTKKSSRTRRLLIIDGHSSHTNMEFFDLCDKLRIVVLILPPHSTHRLQPLDVSLFAPLASYYTSGLNQLMFNSLGMVSISKRDFWGIFWPAWKSAFTESNILSGFRKTGIWPLNPDITLSLITKPPPPTITPDKPAQCVQTPITCRAVRRTQRLYRDTSNPVLLHKILKANERLSAQHSIDSHVIKGLINTVKNEKKKRQRGKRLNLLGQEGSGPQLYGPEQMQQARDIQGQKDTYEAQRRQDIIDKRAAAANKKAQQESDRLQRAAQATYRRQLACDAQAQKAVEKQSQAELKKAFPTPKKKQASRKKVYTEVDEVPRLSYSRGKKAKSTVAVANSEVPVFATSTGRRVCRPQRFNL